MRVARLLSIAVVVVFLAGCGQAHRQTQHSTLQLTVKDNRKEFTIRPHGEIVLTLPSDRSTRYRWQWTAERSPMGAGLRTISHRYIPPAKSAPGAAGVETWRLRAVGNEGIMVQGLVFGRLLSQPRPRHWSVARRFDFYIVVS